MNKKLDKQINEKVDFLIDNVTNKNTNKSKNLNEGVLGSILYFLNLAGVPKHKKFKSYQKNYLKCVATCAKTYKDEKTVYTSSKDTYDNMEKSKERDIKDTEKMDEQMIKENPEKAKCITRCRVSFLKGIIELANKEGKDKLCEKNKFKDACEKWMEDKLPDLEVELEYLDKAVNKISKMDNPSQVKNVMKKINQTIYK